MSISARLSGGETLSVKLSGGETPSAQLSGGAALSTQLSGSETPSAQLSGGVVLSTQYVGHSAVIVPIRVVTVDLPSSAWVGDASPYFQVVNIDGATPNSLVDLQPSVEQLAIFHEKDLAFSTVNEDGVVTVFAIGDRPQNDYAIQATVTEVRT